jgi:hypothetical protein
VLLSIGIVGLVLVALASQRLVAESSATPDPTRGELCAELDALAAAVSDDAVFATQEINHRARKLSRWADVYEAPTSTATQRDDDQPPVAQAGQDIRWVLSSVAWESADLITATRPIALECGWTWPLTTQPPAAQPRPPST